MTSAGERLTIGPNGTLSRLATGFKAAPSPSGGTQYRIEARTTEEARRRVSELKRKHPEIDVEATLASAQMVETYPQGWVGHDLSIGGELAGRSMVKSCLAWAFANGVEWALCRKALDCLRGGADPPFGYYHDTDLVEGRPAGVPFNCPALDANPVGGLILGYGEYFGFHRFVCLLGEDYGGPAVRGSYALDPRTGAEIDVTVRLPFLRADIDDIYAYNRTKPDDLKRAADAILGPAMQARHEAERARVASRAIDQAFATCGASPGEMLMEAQRQKLFLSIAQKIAPDEGDAAKSGSCGQPHQC